MLRRSLAAFAILLSGATSASAAERVAGVVELFTSQGCSSCPPADALMEELAHRPDLVALSLPVDYWDRLGWKDTFGSPAYSARQRAYSLVRGDGAVYTPQAVVNGRAHMNGASQYSIDNAIADGAGGLPVPVGLNLSGTSLEVSVGAVTGSSIEPAVIVLMPYLASRSVRIGRGENAHRTVTYSNIVRRIETLGSWRGQPFEIEVPRAALQGFDGVAVLVQSGSANAPGPVIGAARLALN